MDEETAKHLFLYVITSSQDCRDRVPPRQHSKDSQYTNNSQSDQIVAGNSFSQSPYVTSPSPHFNSPFSKSPYINSPISTDNPLHPQSHQPPAVVGRLSADNITSPFRLKSRDPRQNDFAYSEGNEQGIVLCMVGLAFWD